MTIWRNEVKIKNLLNNDESNNKVLEICNILIPQLEKILVKETARGYLDEYWLEDNFEPIIEDFKFLKRAIENKENPEKFDFESWCDAFNNFLANLY